MATVQQTLRNPFYRNWVKGGLTLKFTRDGIQCFVNGAVQNFRQKCLEDIWAGKGLAVDTVCNVCTTQNVLPCPTRGTCAIRHGVCKYHDNSDPLKTYRPCPSGICNDLKDIIYNSHRFRGPSWHNTNAQLWCSDSWEVAKCYIASSGYTTVTSAAQTDFSGLVSIVINLKEFQNIIVDNLSRQNNLFCQARSIRNDILHTATFELTDVVLNDYIDTMILLLNDQGLLARNGNVQTAVTMLNQLKTDSIAVTNEDEQEMREQALRVIDEKKEEVIKEIEETMCEKKEEVKKHIKETIDEKKIDTIKYIKKTVKKKKKQAIKHIHETVERQKDEITKHIKQTVNETHEETIKHIQETVEGKKEEAKTNIQETMDEAEVIQGKGTQAYENNKTELCCISTVCGKRGKIGKLISKCLPMLLRKHVEKHVNSCKPDSLSSDPWTLDDFLDDNREAITNPNTRGHQCVLTPIQQKMLFPGRRKTTDIEQWDLSMLCFIFLGYCKPSQHLRDDIERMKLIRNEISHIEDPNISIDNVDNIKILIQRGLKELGDSDFEKEINEIITDVENNRLNMEDPFFSVKEWFNNEALQNSFQGMSPETNQKITETLEIIERKLSISEQDRHRFYQMCTVVLVIQNSRGDKERYISQLLKEILDDQCVQQVLPTLTKEEQVQLNQAAETFIKQLCLSGEREIVKVDIGCLIITVKCTSMKSLYTLWQECARGDVTSYLHPIQRCIRELDGCERVEITALVEESEVSRCLQQLAELDISQQDVMINAVSLKNSNENTDDSRLGSKLKLDIKRKSLEQVRHIAYVCKSGELNRHLEIVSKTVEDILNIKDISIKALFEEEQMSNDLKEDSSSPGVPYSSHAKTEMSQDHEQQQADASVSKTEEIVEIAIPQSVGQKVYLDTEDTSSPDLPYLLRLQTEMSQDHNQQQCDASVATEEETVKTSIRKTEMEPVDQKVYLESDTATMATVLHTLRNPLYRNWVKGGLVLKFTRNGLQCFVDGAVQDFQQRCLNDIWAMKSLVVNTVCNVCTTRNVLPCPTRGTCSMRHGVCNYHDNSDPLKTYRPCPSGICNDLQDIIYKSHRFRGPSWHNTNAQLWCSNSWEIAKCFMAAGGYSTVTSAVQTDFTGLISVVINLKDFQNIVVDNLFRQNNLFCQARTIQNNILHTASFELTDVLLNDYIDTMVLLLNDPGNLARDGNAQTAVTMLNQLRTDSKTVTNEDEKEIRDQALRAIDERKEEVIRSIEEKGDEPNNKKVKQEGLLQVTNIQEKAEETKEEVKEEFKQEGILQITNFHEKAEEMEEEMKEKVQEEGLLQVKNIQEKAGEMKEAMKDEVKKEGLLQITNIQKEKEKTIRHIQESHKSKITKELKTERNVIAEMKRQAYINEKKDLQVELIKLYREDYTKESIYPHSPEEEDMAINDIYVKPHLEIVDLQSKQKGDKTDNKTVHSYKDILYKESYPCKSIYLTAKAGMGKTTFCKRLIFTWCNAHSENRDDGNQYEDFDDDTDSGDDTDGGDDTSLENEQVIRKFPFLFYVSLRHAGSTSEIEKMIKDQLLLKRKHKALLDVILEEEPDQCLIILDGLDEWSPPEGHRQKLVRVTKALPARSTTVGCSILTTTRPWKLDVLKLKTSEIDKQIECLGIDEDAADKFIRSIILNLNFRRRQSRNAEDFRYELERRKLDKLKTVPLLLKQLVCLWHAGKSRGHSKCAIYSEMISLMFELAETRLVDNPELSYIKEKNQNVRISLPKCFNGLQLCQEFKSLIYSLSYLSFTTLMKKNEESALVFDSSALDIHGLSRSEIEICLKVGILSQSKVISAENTRQKSFSFIHKTFQEFLAAVFVSVSRDSSDKTIKIICSKINTVGDVLQQSEFLEFVSGMFPDILYQLTEHICRVASHDAYEYRQSVTDSVYRRYMHKPITDIGRSMTQCLLESKYNGYENISIKREDIFIDEDSM